MEDPHQGGASPLGLAQGPHARDPPGGEGEEEGFWGLTQGLGEEEGEEEGKGEAVEVLLGRKKKIEK